MINLVFITLLLFSVFAQKINLDTLNNYSEFLNFGDKKISKLTKGNLENAIFKSKVDILGEIFKKNVDILKKHDKLDVVFLVDASSSVGEENFQSELKFVKKLLSDITVDYNHTRVAVVTFSSSNEININVDEVSQPSKEHNKCLLLNKQLGKIDYTGGGTYTVGAFEAAKKIFYNSHRNNTRKALFLITDGYSNGGDPIPLSKELKDNQTLVFTIGIRSGNYKELYDISSSPGELYSYLLDSFQEFEGLARRALHVDLKNGEYVPLGINSPCDGLCKEGNCCDENAMCSCGTTTGHYSCICKLGYYGSGLKNSCLPCIQGTYSVGPNTCLPCPDINHETSIPAIGLKSCKCKIGYHPTPGNKCKPIKCPKITIPEHGYLVKKKECGNVVNSACGIRCEVGYTLIGNSIRLCQANATWSGKSPSCEVKVCTALTPPKFGSMVCSHSENDIDSENLGDLPVDATCTFKCDPGKNLIGSRQRTCLPLARWDGLRTLCKPIKCSKLTQIKNGKFEPKNCIIGKQEFGKNCTIMCNPGFEIRGSPYRVCNGQHGTWNEKLEYTTCVDKTPPSLKCPQNITTLTLPGKNYGYANWDIPTVTDNSEDGVTVWMKPVIKDITNFKFQIGSTRIRYYAHDTSMNRINCSFYVIVQDKELPIIENCEDPPTFLSSNKIGANVSWDEPNIYDNSQIVKINQSHSAGFFPLGTTTISYKANDSSNNTNICFLNITVEEAQCEPLSDPIFGHSTCSKVTDGAQCVITCEEGYAIPLNQNFNYNDDNSTNFYCKNVDPIWINQDDLLYPECSVTQIPDVTNQSGQLNIKTDYDVCNNSDINSDLKNDISTTLINNLCEGGCSFEAEYKCEDDLEKEEEDTNIIKRDTSTIDTALNKTRTKKYRKKIKVKFQVKGQFLKNNNNNNETNLTIGKGQRAGLVLYQANFTCVLGFVPRKHRCVQCPRGTFHNTTANACHSCPLGFYNSELGQIKCTACPVNYSTRKFRSKSVAECREQCSPGTHAKKKVIKLRKHKNNSTIERLSLSPHCRSCNVGFFQPNYGQLHCIPCPSGFTTAGYRSTTFSQCIPTAEQVCKSNTNICNNGTCVVINQYQYYCKCSKNYYGTFCEKGHSPCDSNPCLNMGSCFNSKFNTEFECKCAQGYTGKYCQEIITPCDLRCQNKGVCVESDENDFICLCPDGYGGDLCEIPIIHCIEGICEHNGICEENTDTFNCICTGGYIGRRCSILPCDYQPCKDNSICVNIMEPNATKNSYRCMCPDGYTGKYCSEKISYCEPNPCKNNGVCISETYTYKCNCPKLFTGKKCEFDRPTNYFLEFPRYDINDYIQLEGFKRNISEITICLWIETTDSFNYGTLVSYATSKFDNSFTLTDYTGLILYVNNKYIVTDILLNDGHWHHLCASWEGSKGNFQIFADGKLLKNGSFLDTGSSIEGFGNLVIGQEQDVLGGKFSQSESFKGKIAFIDIWSYMLTENEVKEHMNSCDNTKMGDLYAWSEIKENVKGNIKVVDSTFCQKCKEPKPVYNSVIKIKDNIAYYSCYDGYKLSTNVYENGRKCTKFSIWEGLHEPYCRKIYCGYPGYVMNSNSVGRNYYYNDKISYSCYDGYKLEGVSTIVCNKHGKWFPNRPTCIGKQCTLEIPDHSKFEIISDLSTSNYNENITKFDVGTQIEIFCRDNYNLTGESLLTCLENGQWDFPLPMCEKIEKNTTNKLQCSFDFVPLPPTNGYIDLESLWDAKNGTTNFIKYNCREGYYLEGDSNATCIIDGYWSEVNVSCNPITCSKPKRLALLKPKYKEEIKDLYIFGNKITYECQRGYKFDGNDTIRCQDNGEWSQLLGKCIKVCKKPFVASTTVVTGTSYDTGSSIKILCSSGSEYTLVCSRRGVWEGHADSTC